MKLNTQKRISADVLKVGVNKVWFDPSKSTEIKEAITKDDIRRLVKQKVIKKILEVSQSRGRIKKANIQKSKGQRKGAGSRKGKKTARLPKKKAWMAKIRIQRKFLKELKINEIIEVSTYRDLFLKAKGGYFRSKRHIKTYLSENNLTKNE